MLKLLVGATVLGSKFAPFFHMVKVIAAIFRASVRRQKWAQGEVVVIRYADDTVLGLQHKTDADRFLKNLRERLAMFGLELHPDKTRRFEFGRFAEENRKRRGGRKTRDVLGFSHITGKNS